MQPDDAAGVTAIDMVAADIRELASIEDPIAFGRARKVAMAKHGLSAGAVDGAVKRERKLDTEIAAPLDDAAAQAEIGRLSKLTPLAYARERDAAAARIGIAVGPLNDLVKRERGEETGQGKPIELPDPEPWDEPVDGARLLSDIATEVRRYMILADGAAEMVALWTIHTHTLDAFGISPRLAITSPRPGCGKTTLLDVLHHLVPRPLLMANITAAAVFRTVEIARPVLLADEADTYLKDNDELRGILNSGHRKGGNVVRVVGDDNEPRQFSTWGACAIAMIGKLPATLADRSVPVELQRKRPDEKVTRFRFDLTEELDALARKSARWAKDNTAKLKGADPAIPSSLSNRAADNWRPLLTIADAAGGDWPRRARAIADAMVDADQSKRTSLLADIRDIFATKAVEQILSEELVNELAALEGHDWAEYRNGKSITVNQLAALLKPDAITPGTVRFAPGPKGTKKGYKLTQFSDAFARYLPPIPPNQAVTPSQPAENLGSQGIPDPSQGNWCVASRNTEKPQNSAGCDGVTFPKEDVPEDVDEEDTIDWRGGL
jgi:putative DNA primase/helicase